MTKNILKLTGVLAMVGIVALVAGLATGNTSTLIVGFVLAFAMFATGDLI